MKRDSDEVELARIIHRASVLRTGFICFTILAGLAIVCVSIVRIVSKPAWLTLILAILGSTLFANAMMALTLWLRGRYIRKHHRRIAGLEKQLDPERSSSEE